MDQSTFLNLLDQLKGVKLSRDKFYILQNSSSLYFFSGQQLCDVALTFPHSSDKKEAVELLEKRLVSHVPSTVAATIIKGASFSRDRLRILQVLVNHLGDIENQTSQKAVVNAFDFFIDKDEAWDIMKKKCQDQGTSCMALPSPYDIDEEMSYRPENVQSLIKELAEPNIRVTVFELPIMNELQHFQNFMTDMKADVAREVERRRQEGTNFLIPSKIWTISTKLKPGRRLTLPPPSKNLREFESQQHKKFGVIDESTPPGVSGLNRQPIQSSQDYEREHEHTGDSAAISCPSFPIVGTSSTIEEAEDDETPSSPQVFWEESWYETNKEKIDKSILGSETETTVSLSSGGSAASSARDLKLDWENRFPSLFSTPTTSRKGLFDVAAENLAAREGTADGPSSSASSGSASPGISTSQRPGFVSQSMESSLNGTPHSSSQYFNEIRGLRAR